jgi:Carboxypeptidase regulatory-like domain
MMRFAMLALFCTPCVLQAQGTGKITGKVIDAATLQPIPKVHVASNTGGPGGPFVGTLTGPDGAYTLEDVPAGSIVMTINLDGYKMIYGRSEPNAAFPLAADDTLRRDFALHPQGRVYGRLIDRDTGKGITGHTVSAVRKEFVPGHTFFSPRPGEGKGDEFNIANLEPGEYLLQIDPEEEAAFVFPAGGSPKPAPNKCYGQSWYPDASSIEAAVPIHLAEGESRRLDISLHSRETHSISGTLKAPRELAGQPLTITLQTTVLNGWVATMPAPGTFRIDNLAPGSYRLGLIGGKPLTDTKSFRDYVLFELDAGRTRETPAVDGVGDYVFEIADHDIDNFNIALLPYAGVTGEVRMLEKDAKLPPKLGVVLMPTADYLVNLKTGGAIGGGPMTIRGTGVQADTGRFHQEWMHPSEYWPQLNGLPDGYAVAQVLFEGASPSGSTITLSTPDTPLTFVLTSRPGAIVGTVRDDNQDPVRGAEVVLLPDPLPDKVGPEVVQTRQAGDDGGVSFRNLAPGKYRALVLSHADLAGEGDPDYLRQRAADVEAIEVGAGQVVRMELKK